MCAWKDWDASMKVIAGMIAGPNLSSTSAPTDNGQRVPPQHALYYPMPPELTLASARLCAEITRAAAQHKLKTPVFRHVQRAAAPLRVGVMSSQFGANSLGWTLQFFFSELRQPMLRGRTGVYALALTNSDGSKVRADIEGSAANQW
jgi:predicted O-linked N-acetylglucosamine transferase (SPINDLY family)